MTRTEFIQLLALGAKRIDQDLIFEYDPLKEPARKLKTVEVFNTGGVKVRLEGHYNSLFDSITFNFVCPDAGGPICRVDVRSTAHPPVGRTHKHDLQTDNDPRNNLPVATARPDLESASPADVWQDLCTRANIHFTGAFVDPRALIVPIV